MNGEFGAVCVCVCEHDRSHPVFRFSNFRIFRAIRLHVVPLRFSSSRNPQSSHIANWRRQWLMARKLWFRDYLLFIDTLLSDFQQCCEYIVICGQPNNLYDCCHSIRFDSIHNCCKYATWDPIHLTNVCHFSSLLLLRDRFKLHTTMVCNVCNGSGAGGLNGSNGKGLAWKWKIIIIIIRNFRLNLNILRCHRARIRRRMKALHSHRVMGTSFHSFHTAGADGAHNISTKRKFQFARHYNTYTHTHIVIQSHVQSISLFAIPSVRVSFFSFSYVFVFDVRRLLFAHFKITM